MRVLLVLLVLLVCGVTFGETVFQDFEADHFKEWTVEGEAFGKGPARGSVDGQQPVAGFSGNGLANSFHGGDETKGTLTSPEFTIEHKFIQFQIGGGNHPVETGLELLVDGKRVRTATGSHMEVLKWQSWDVGELMGKGAKLRIFDHATGDFGHVLVDQIVFADQPKHGYEFPELEAYRKSPEFRRERFRPVYHFTPDRNWINDPNGLVFFDGEYHLFYQHNPWGNAWGHMSWGHAVSSDMVRWEHLPIALYEEDGIMIFSGCCVVDHQNSAGFGEGGAPPLVAIYSGHGKGKQTQNLAYSTDRGRTWTKYAGNPVIDLNSTDFRDPKVFWHAPSRQWVMVVSLALQHRLFFYGSDNLKEWTKLSEFGPAGAPIKPNWECPDLFELPIENEPGRTAWVLEVDLGNDAVAGGSGGEYFVGNFDGKRFVSSEPLDTVRWVDYGRDFYAPVSFSDIPASDGRRIWIGWMNNWETHLVPTSPWRGAMSIPRTVTLRRIDGRLQLIQRPIAELQQIRRDHQAFRYASIQAGATPQLKETSHCELLLRFRPQSATTFGVRVHVGKDCQTEIGYDQRRQELYVDRTNSGVTDFHGAFPGKHAAPMRLRGDELTLRVFLDRSSVEVFANDGEVVITDRVFPHEGSNGIEFFAEGGDAELVAADAWVLEP